MLSKIKIGTKLILFGYFELKFEKSSFVFKTSTLKLIKKKILLNEEKFEL